MDALLGEGTVYSFVPYWKGKGNTLKGFNLLPMLNKIVLV